MIVLGLGCNVETGDLGENLLDDALGKGGGIRTPNTLVEKNDPSTLNAGNGRVLTDTPIALLGRDISPPVDRTAFMTSSQQFITSKTRLQYDCELPSPFNGTVISTCMETKQTQVSNFTSKQGGTWGYHPNSAEFLEIQAFYHSKISIEDFFGRLVNSKTLSGNAGDVKSSIPSTYLSATPNFWYSSADADTPKLKVYSHCSRSVGKPAFYSATFEVCLGNADNLGFPSFNYSEDPTIIQHEMGHVFSQTIFNSRNIASAGLSTDRRVNFGGDLYSELDVISEGFSDWYSHIMTGRDALFEWVGKLVPVKRPVTESSNLHPSTVGTDASSRLKYPDFLTFNVHDQNSITQDEDPHLGGQIISHFLVTMQRELKSVCSLTTTDANNALFIVLQETISEMGDLTSDGFDASASDTVNLIQDVSEVWVEKNNPPNIRSFAQKFGKHFLRIVNGTSVCNNIIFGQDRLEQVLDSHGLLLFKTYNTDGNGTTSGHAAAPTTVTSLNRVNSVLLPKASLRIDGRSGQPTHYILDDRTTVANLITDFVASGKTLESELGNPNLVNAVNNNGNNKVSPGEVIGVALNLYNNSNVTMGGVQVLANDWDHVKVDSSETKLCNNFEDGFPLSSEGAASADAATPADGDCGFITRENGAKVTEVNETVAPICFVHKIGTTETSWVSQSEFADFRGFAPSQCLMGSANPDECFFRAIPGGDNAWFSKIDPNKNWAETFDPAGAASPTFQSNNVIFFEVNKNTPPGTLINCRFRARFTNCDDCWHDSTNSDDDYLDFEYAGGTPYRIFNIQFQVLD